MVQGGIHDCCIPGIRIEERGKKKKGEKPLFKFLLMKVTRHCPWTLLTYMIDESLVSRTIQPSCLGNIVFNLSGQVLNKRVECFITEEGETCYKGQFRLASLMMA